jgi:hypothetical protein
MAKLVILVDDVDGESPADETMPFVFDGQAYSLDLCADNAKAFREAVEPFLSVATRLGKHKIDPTPGSRRSASPSAGTDGKQWYRSDAYGDGERERKKKRYRNQVRQWAKTNGYDVGDRGVLPEEVYDAYEEHCRREGLPTGPGSVGL